MRRSGVCLRKRGMAAYPRVLLAISTLTQLDFDDPSLQSGGYMDSVLRGPGYPTPVVPSLARGPSNDRFAKLKQYMDDIRVGRSNERKGFMRVDV